MNDMLALLLQDVAAALKKEWADRNDASKWDAAVETVGQSRRTAKLTSVSIEVTGFRWVVQDGSATYTVQALPALHKAQIELDGSSQPNAAMVDRLVPSPALPGRFHLDIRPVSIGSNTVRFDFAFPNKR